MKIKKGWHLYLKDRKTGEIVYHSKVGLIVEWDPSQYSAIYTDI